MDPGEAPVREGERRTPAEDFEDFLMDIYGAGDEEKSRLFRELLGELETEDRES
jgi:hypothetical protein